MSGLDRDLEIYKHICSLERLIFALYEFAACSPLELLMRVFEVGSFEHKRTLEYQQHHGLPSRHGVIR